MQKKINNFLTDQKGQASIEFILFVIFIFFIIYTGFFNLGVLLLNKQRIEIVNSYVVHTMVSAKTPDRDTPLERKAFTIFSNSDPVINKADFINRDESQGLLGQYKISQIRIENDLSFMMRQWLNLGDRPFILHSHEIKIRGPQYK